jgi:UDP-N-acetylmuramoyl-tripeptide--D-alanyl-D-alanine ligase
MVDAGGDILWSAEEAALATGGKATEMWQATGVSIDSRTVNKGDVFIALKGEHLDGHGYVDSAFSKGAIAAVVQQPIGGGPQLLVANSMKAMEDLAKAARRRMQGRVVGITGSVGKTSTRAMMAAVLAAYGKVHATQGNYNNHYGVPLTLARMPQDTAYGVIEMGMNHAGEIAALTLQVRPHVAVITSVEAVHLEHFASVEGIADAKAEIFDGLEAGGTAILPRDNLYFERLVRKAERRGARVVSFGTHEKADVRLLDAYAHGWHLHGRARVMQNDVDFSLPHPGRHFAVNALAVLASLDVLGLDLPSGIAALARVKLEEGRGLPAELFDGSRHIMLMDDSYNASPASMKAAFEVLANLDGVGRKIAVLGDMLELGEHEIAMHKDLAAYLMNAGIDKLYAAGSRMAALYKSLPIDMRGAHTEKAADLLPILMEELQHGDFVLTKGSHGSHIYKLAAMLREQWVPTPQPHASRN